MEAGWERAGKYEWGDGKARPVPSSGSKGQSGMMAVLYICRGCVLCVCVRERRERKIRPFVILHTNPTVKEIWNYCLKLRVRKWRDGWLHLALWLGALAALAKDPSSFPSHPCQVTHNHPKFLLQAVCMTHSGLCRHLYKYAQTNPHNPPIHTHK